MKLCLRVLLAALVVSGIALLTTNARGEKEPAKKTDEEDIADTLKKAVETNLEGLNKKDLEMTMLVVHPESVNYEPTKKAITYFNEQYDLKCSLIAFKFICLDGDYAIVRIKQRTNKIKGPGFKDNEVDMYHIFRKDKDAWKIWQSTILETTYLEKEEEREEEQEEE